MANIAETQTEEVANYSSNSQQFQLIDVTKGIPNLEESQVLPFDFMSDYWTPETLGESKRLIFSKIDMAMVKDAQTDAMIELECAYFFEASPSGEIKLIRNGSKRLVGALQANNTKHGTPLLITYLGKKANRTNAFKSDNWSIKPLLINIG